jgi:predicted MFS family arabinose efflux permease
MESLPGDTQPAASVELRLLYQAAETRPPKRGLWRHRDFMRLWAGQTISKFGSQIGGGALALTAILALSATPVQMGLLLAASSVPVLLVGLLAGVWVDRLRRRPLMIMADLGRALLLASIPIAALLGLLQIGQLYIVVALVSVLTIFFDVAYETFLPSLVRREQLVEGNSKLGQSDSIAEIGGPPLGGALVQMISAPLTIAFDAVSFLFSALFLWRIHALEPLVEQPTQRPSIWQDIGAGLRATLGSPLLRVLLGGTVIFNLGGGIIGSLYGLYAIRELGLTPTMLGVVIGVGGVSALLGALIAERVARRLGLGRAITVALTVIAGMGILLPLAHGSLAIPLLILGQAGDAAWSIYLISALSLRQSITPARLLGRVNASMQFLAAGAAPLGAVAGGVLGELIGLRATLAFGVAIIMCACLWGICSPLRRLRALPEAAEEADRAGHG